MSVGARHRQLRARRRLENGKTSDLLGLGGEGGFDLVAEKWRVPSDTTYDFRKYFFFFFLMKTSRGLGVGIRLTIACLIHFAHSVRPATDTGANLMRTTTRAEATEIEYRTGIFII